MRDAIVLGGPNGAGKTTAAAWLLPSVLGVSEFVNADEIARGMSPFNPGDNPFAAGRLMLQRAWTLAQSGRSFAIETTCAGMGHARLLRLCRASGYRIVLVFLWLPSPEAAIARVAQRVRAGGHHIPPFIVERRYAAGLRNLCRLYLPLADIALIYDNSRHGGPLIAERTADGRFVIHDEKAWQEIQAVSQ